VIHAASFSAAAMGRNNYKETLCISRMKRGDKRGQVALFIIVAIVIVVAALVVILYRGPRLPGGGEFQADPRAYLTACLQPALQPALERVMLSGGSANPLGFIVYNNTKIAYLCYTAEYYRPCIVQQPNVQGHIERELATLLTPEAAACVARLKEDFESRGYRVAQTNVRINVSMASNSLQVLLNAPMTISKDFTKTYSSLEIAYPSQYYDILAIATSIIDFESTYGDSETTLYMRSYPDIRIEKVKLSDGTKIYTVSNVITHERFTFASRGLSWPSGLTGT